MRFADDYLNELKPGDILIFTGDPDNDFYTHKAEYKVHQNEDQQDLFLIDDSDDEELLNEYSGQFFVLKETDETLRARVAELEAAYSELDKKATRNIEYLKTKYKELEKALEIASKNMAEETEGFCPLSKSLVDNNFKQFCPCGGYVLGKSVHDDECWKDYFLQQARAELAGEADD